MILIWFGNFLAHAILAVFVEATTASTLFSHITTYNWTVMGPRAIPSGKEDWEHNNLSKKTHLIRQAGTQSKYKPQLLSVTIRVFLARN